MSSPKPVLLRLLSGLNAGASMELAPGEWILGSGDASELLVMDQGVHARHLALRVGEDGRVILVPLEGEVGLDSAPVPAEGLPLEDFAVFSAGSLTACVGPADSVWPELRTPAAAPAPTPGPEDPDPILSGPTRPEPESANLVGDNKSGRWTKRRKLQALAAGLLLLALAVGVFPNGETPTDELTLMLRDAGFSGVSAQNAPAGGLLVQGLVPSNAVLDSLGVYLSGVAPEATIDVLSVESVAQALQARINRADAALRVSRSGSNLRVTGYVFDLDALRRLFAEDGDLLNQVPAKIDVVTWEELAPALTRLIQARDLKSRLRVIPGAYRIAVQAQSLTEAQEESLAALLREAEASAGDTAPFVREVWEQPTRVTPPAGGSGAAGTDEGSSRPLLLFSSQSTGALQCGNVSLTGSGPDLAVLFEGVRYRVGAKLPNGYQLRAVTPEYVVFQIGRRYTQICTPKEMNREE